MLLANENLFLIALGFIWIIGAVLQDLKRREVDNIWNFSLIAFALGYRAIISVYNGDIWFFANGLSGLAIFLFLGNLFYYARLFAGGDAKLLIALGAILPLSYSWMINLKIFGIFILLFLVAGSIYAMVWSFFLIGFNFSRFKKEFFKQIKYYKKIFFVSLIFAVLWIVFSVLISQLFLILIALIILLFPILFVFSKAVEESCMVKAVSPMNVTEGDWLYEDIIVNGKRINADWEGVSLGELNLIKKFYRRKVLIKQGIPFTPAFLFALIILIVVDWRWAWMI